LRQKWVKKNEEYYNLHASVQIAVCACIEASFGPKDEYERLKRIADEIQNRFFELKRKLIDAN